MKDKELIVAKKVAYIMIIVCGIVEFSLVTLKIHGGIHFYGLFLAGLGETAVNFIKKSAFKWCTFYFTCMYGILIVYCVVFSIN